MEDFFHVQKSDAGTYNDYLPTATWLQTRAVEYRDLNNEGVFLMFCSCLRFWNLPYYFLTTRWRAKACFSFYITVPRLRWQRSHSSSHYSYTVNRSSETFYICHYLFLPQDYVCYQWTPFLRQIYVVLWCDHRMTLNVNVRLPSSKTLGSSSDI